MAKAYVLINTELGAEEEVVRALDEILEVRETYVVYGVYDMIAILETETIQEIKDAIFTKIRAMEKIKSTITMMVID